MEYGNKTIDFMTVVISRQPELTQVMLYYLLLRLGFQGDQK